MLCSCSGASADVSEGLKDGGGDMLEKLTGGICANGVWKWRAWSQSSRQEQGDATSQGEAMGKCPELGVGETREPRLKKEEDSVLGNGLLGPPLLLLNHARHMLAA